MKYSIFIDEEFRWNIMENSTDQIITSFFFEEDAKDYVEFLEDGGAFDGWTPNFMLSKIVVDDINQRFNIAFES